MLVKEVFNAVDVCDNVCFDVIGSFHMLSALQVGSWVLRVSLQ